jgi:phosphoglucomutase
MHAKAGEKAPAALLENIPTLIANYYNLIPDSNKPEEKVSFGTSGHRGNANRKSFNEAHIIAITQALCDYRKEHHITGPIYMGKDTHALSTPAQMTAIRVLATNKIQTYIAKDDEYTPTPLVSFAILQHNAKDDQNTSDGIVITPSHNPPSDGGFKYNPPNGGPADTNVTNWIEKRANELLQNKKRPELLSYEESIKSGYIEEYDFITPYVEALPQIVNIEAIRRAGIKIGVDPMGGASIGVYKKIQELHQLNITIVNPYVDPTFSFMTLDHDGKIRMDCSSPYAMASLIDLKNNYDIAFGNDPDADRHGIVTKSHGLLNPNHYLSVAIKYLFKNRPQWDEDLKIGKTLVSSAMIDRIANALNRKVYEVPVGFKWFSLGLFNAELGFGGEESAGASFLRFDGSTWTTDKDGIILNLLAAEILAITEEDPGEIYRKLEEKFGTSYYQRIDAPATPQEKAKIKALQPEDITVDKLGGEKIEAIFTKAPGNHQDIGGIKATAKSGWIAIRPSGTEDIYKIYAESFKSWEHLQLLLEDAAQLIADTISKSESE